jgi:hypothetical protein
LWNWWVPAAGAPGQLAGQRKKYKFEWLPRWLSKRRRVEECSCAEQSRAEQEGQWEQLLLVWFKERGFGRPPCARLVINSYFLGDGVQWCKKGRVQGA